MSKLEDCFRPEKVTFNGPEFRITKVASGKNHTAFIDTKGGVLVCGSNDYGQLSLGSVDPLKK